MIINQLAVVITIPFLAAKLDSSVFGIVSLSLILIQTGWIIADWGVANYSIEKWKQNATIFEKNKLTTNLIVSKFVLVILYLFFVGFLVLYDAIQLPWPYFFIVIISTISGAIYPFWFFTVNKINNSLVFVTLITRLSFLCLVFLLVNKNTGLIYMFLHASSFFVITIYSFILMVKKCNYLFKGLEVKEITYHIKKGTNYFLNTIATNNINMIWSFLFSITQGAYIVGVYNIAEQGYRAGNTVSNMITNVIRLNTKSLNSKKTWSVVYFYICIYFFIALFSFLIIEPLIKLLFDSKYYLSIDVLFILIWVWFFQSCIRLLNYPILGEMITINKIHSFSPYIIFSHIFMFCVWFFYSGDILNFAIYFLVTSFFQFIFFILTIIKNTHKN